MAEQRSEVYRGATRQDAERAYHEGARRAAGQGYVPVSEDWSTALGQQVLSVTYHHDPAEAPRVLKALADPKLQTSQEPRAVEVRTYKGRSQSEAAAKLAADAGPMSGYEPTQQIWSGPRYWPVFVAPLILLIVGFLIAGWGGAAIFAIIGIIVVLFSRPKGELTVTWTHR